MKLNKNILNKNDDEHYKKIEKRRVFIWVIIFIIIIFIVMFVNGGIIENS